jgi:hypothetical protein
MPLTVDLNTEQKVRITANPTTASGAPAALDGALQAELVSGDGTVLPGDTPLQVQLLAGADVTQPSVFRLFGDADLGSGIVAIEDTVTLNVSAALAFALGLVASAPEPK